MIQIICENCRFFNTKGVLVEHGYGECRRYPPVLNQEVMRVASEAYQEENPNESKDIASYEGGCRTILGWQFPVMSTDEWCGEFLKKEPVTITSFRQRAQRAETEADRDKWVYEQLLSGNTTQAQVLISLKNECAARGWSDTLNTGQALVKAANRHAAREGISPIPKRK